MKSLMLALFLTILANPALAKQFYSTIHSIDMGKISEPHFVRFDNGRVSFVLPDKTALLRTLDLSRERKEFLEVQVDRNNNLTAIRSIPTKQTFIGNDGEMWIKNVNSYKPSVLKNTNDALKIFKNMRKSYSRNGECYNRAHIWAYEEFQRSKLNSMKVFMFFTERYIRKYKYHWWFHVTPMTYVKTLKSPRTLDRRYSSGPRQTKTWSDIFIRSKRSCRVVTKYDDFWLNQEKEDCYHIQSSMYYVIPRDLEKRDITGLEKAEFHEKEIIRAYRNGFNI